MSMANASKDRPLVIDLAKRSTLRGLKKCPCCGQINGQRAYLCRNTNCELWKKSRPYEPVRLVTSQKDTKIFSLRCKERDSQHRGFVILEDISLELGETPSDLLAHKSICFVDACKNENINSSKLACKHIKACNKIVEVQAEVYPVTYAALWKLNIDENQKHMLWKLCQDRTVPAVQRLNSSSFAVKCGTSEVFPAGRLHVTALSNGVFTKKARYACSCKKLKIIVEPDNSLVMQEEICDHILLVLAAVLSKSDTKNLYSEFLNALHQFWMPHSVAGTFTHIDSQEDSFLGLNISQGAIEQAMSADELLICLFGNDYIANEQLSDLAFKDAENACAESSSSIAMDSGSTDDFYSGDPNFVSSCNIHEGEEHDIEFCGEINTYKNNIETTHLQLTDCNIELMDQFQYTDQIDLSSDGITIPIDGEPINILTVPSVSSESVVTSPVITTTSTAVSGLVPQGQILDKSIPLIPLLPPIELPTISVIKKTQIKAADIMTEVKTRVHPHVPAKRSLILNSKKLTVETEAIEASFSSPANKVISAPALSYLAWLDYIIESMNECITPTKSPKTLIERKFHVHAETFAHFCKSFSTGIKRRTPNDVSLLTNGKHKGLNNYIWVFNSRQTVKRIFTSQNLTLQTERFYEKTSDGSFIPYIREKLNSALVKQRRLYSQLNRCVVQIMFGSDQSNQHMNGVRVAWTPNILPASKFGLLCIEFMVKTRDHSFQSS